MDMLLPPSPLPLELVAVSGDDDDDDNDGDGDDDQTPLNINPGAPPGSILGSSSPRIDFRRSWGPKTSPSRPRSRKEKLWGRKSQTRVVRTIDGRSGPQGEHNTFTHIDEHRRTIHKTIQLRRPERIIG